MREILFRGKRIDNGELVELLCTAGWNLFTDNNAINQVADHLITHNVTVPPVSVGQKVYIIRRPIDKPEWIDECVLKNVVVEYAADGKTCRFKSHNFEATEKDIGAWVFLTREEAEKALKERG